MANPPKVPAVHEPLDVAVALLTLHRLKPTGPVESLGEGDSNVILRSGNKGAQCGAAKM